MKGAPEISPVIWLERKIIEQDNEIVQMREDMVKIMWLLTQGPDRERDIMAIINPWILKQVDFLGSRAALKERE